MNDGKLAIDQHQTSGANPTDNPSDGVRGFSQKVLRYFLAFLETDFKRQQAPRRRIQLKTDTGFRAGMPIRKYRTLFDAVWKFLQQVEPDNLTFRIKKSAYTAPISPVLRNLIAQHIAELPTSNFDQVRVQTLEYAKRNRLKSVENPEKFIESVQVAFVEAVGTNVVQPILALLDGPFREQAYSAIDSVYEVETDLTDSLTEPAVAQLPETINTLIVKGDSTAMQEVLLEFFAEKDTRERVIAFFEDFATADAFQELRDVLNYARSGENLQFYLYACDMRFGTAGFPLFSLMRLLRNLHRQDHHLLAHDVQALLDRKRRLIVQPAREE
jgi:hypothetical protein